MNIAILALLFLPWFGSDSSEISDFKVEASFFDAAYSRLATEFAEQDQADMAALDKRRKEEAWARHWLEEASAARRAAAEDVAANRSVHGKKARGSSTSASAAQVRLDKAEQKEREAQSTY